MIPRVLYKNIGNPQAAFIHANPVNSFARKLCASSYFSSSSFDDNLFVALKY